MGNEEIKNENVKNQFINSWDEVLPISEKYAFFKIATKEGEKNIKIFGISNEDTEKIEKEFPLPEIPKVFNKNTKMWESNYEDKVYQNEIDRISKEKLVKIIEVSTKMEIKGNNYAEKYTELSKILSAQDILKLANKIKEISSYSDKDVDSFFLG